MGSVLWVLVGTVPATAACQYHFLESHSDMVVGTHCADVVLYYLNGYLAFRKLSEQEEGSHLEDNLSSASK